MIEWSASGVEGCCLVPLHHRISLSGSKMVDRPTKTLVVAEVASTRNTKGSRVVRKKRMGDRRDPGCGRVRQVDNRPAS